MTQNNPPRRDRDRDARGKYTPTPSKLRSATTFDGGYRSAQEQRLAGLASAGPHLLVWATATRQTFTLCRPDGQTVAHDRFHRDLIIDSDDAATEAAALQAIWLAAHGKNLWGADVATLRVVTTRPVADSDALSRAAFTSGLVLDLVADAATNPASEHQLGVWVDWRRADLTCLIQHPRKPL